MRRLTKKQKAFADNYLNEGIGSRAVIKAKYNVKDDHSARSIGSENLAKLNIQQYLAEHAGGAMTRIEELSRESKNDVVKLNANKDILDRAGYKPVDKQDITSKGKEIKNANLIGIDLSNKSYEELLGIIAKEDSSKRGVQD